jgi:hypothetical protein
MWPGEELTNIGSSFRRHLSSAVPMPRSPRSLRKVRGATRRYRDPRTIGWLGDYKYGRRRAAMVNGRRRVRVITKSSFDAEYNNVDLWNK